MQRRRVLPYEVLVLLVLGRLVCASSANAETPPAAADAPDVSQTSPPEVVARERFDRGRALLKEKAYDAALAEFLASRASLRTRGNTQNSAVCYRQLGRFDEALDTFEELLRDFPLSEEDAKSITREIEDLRGRVGHLEIDSNEAGATLLVDGRERGRTPLSAPVRVRAGTHEVRLGKRGFESFATTVTVPGRETVKVHAKLESLREAGRLVVTEAEGRKVTVVVDRAAVGDAPWEGSLAPGPHLVWLRGGGNVGTAPVAAVVRINETTSLALQAAPMSAELRIEPHPASAEVSLDGVALGHGVWEGPLPDGAHTIDVTEDGYFPLRRTVAIAPGRHALVAGALERNELAARWQKDAPSRIALEARLGFAVGPGLGGAVGSDCAAPCSAAPVTGFVGTLHGYYELGFGLGFGIEVGGLYGATTVSERATTIQPVGLPPAPATTRDAFTLGSFLALATVSYRRGDTFSFGAEIGAGAAFSSLQDTRSGMYQGASGAGSLPTQSETTTFGAFVVAPSVRAGYHLTTRFEVGVEGRALLFFPLSRPRWNNSNGAFATNDLGFAQYPTETLTGSVIPLFVPSVYARHDF